MSTYTDCGGFYPHSCKKCDYCAHEKSLRPQGPHYWIPLALLGSLILYGVAFWLLLVIF